MENQNKNLLIFIVLSALMLIGWMQYQMWVAGKVRQNVPPKVQDEEASAWPFGKLPPSKQAQILVGLQAAAGGAGIETPAAVATELALLSHPLPPPPNPWPWYQRGPPVQRAVIAHLAAITPGFGLDHAFRVASDTEVMRLLPPIPRRPEKPVETTVLGDDPEHFLTVELTSRGASVRRVTLQHFQQADTYGLPVWQDFPIANKVETKLELVPHARLMDRTEFDTWQKQVAYDENDPFFHYPLYHYEKSEDEHPLETLGTMVWTQSYKNLESEPQEVAYTADVMTDDPERPGSKIPSVRITKTFKLAKRDYHIGLSVKVQSLTPTAAENHKFRYQLAGSHGLPIEGEWYTYTYRNALVGWVDKKGSATRELETSQQISQKSGGEKLERGDKTIRYAAVAVQYFASALVVDDAAHQPTQHDDFVAWVRATVDGPPAMQKPFLQDFTVRMMSEPIALAPGSVDNPGPAVEHNYLLYNGPLKVRLLGSLTGDNAVAPELVDRYENQLHLRTLTDYHSPGPFGTFANSIWLTDAIIFFTNLMHTLLGFLNSIIPIYGLNIIMLTLLIRGMMFPVTRRQSVGMRDTQEKMAKAAPELKKLKEKYKDDPMGLYREQQELFRRHGVNQFAMLGGCLPVLVQMPIFLGLYYCLQESIAFRLEHFLWIRNLAAPDMMIWWSERIWGVSTPDSQGGLLFLGPYFNLLPVIAVSLMLVQQTMMAPPPTDEQQEMQQKMMKYMMIFMGLMFYKVAAGLCIYFTVSSLWGLAERKLLPKVKPAGGGEIVVPTTSGGGGRPNRNKTTRSSREEEENGMMHRLRSWWEKVLDEARKK